MQKGKLVRSANAFWKNDCKHVSLLENKNDYSAWVHFWWFIWSKNRITRTRTHTLTCTWYKCTPNNADRSSDDQFYPWVGTWVIIDRTAKRQTLTANAIINHSLRMTTGNVCSSVVQSVVSEAVLWPWILFLCTENINLVLSKDSAASQSNLRVVSVPSWGFVEINTGYERPQPLYGLPIYWKFTITQCCC